MSTRSMSRALAAVAGLALAGAASADFTTTVTISATDELGHSTPFSYQIEPNQWVTVDGSPLNWSDPYQDRYFQWGVMDNENAGASVLGETGALVHGFRVQFREDPQVVANFNVAAGPVNTTFTVTSISVGFPSISASEAIGVASAAISVTDSLTFGTPGQIALLGLQSGGNAYSAFFNLGTGQFANLIPGTGGMVAIPQGTTQAFPGFSGGFPGFVPVGTNISEMQSQFRFTLSAGDRAVGTSTYEIIPAPSALGLLGLGAVAGLRRRRA